MRIRFASIVLVLFALALPAQAAAAGGLVYKGTQQLSPRLQELTFSTPALVGDTKVRVLLPAGYDPSGNTRYPVLYLLNGSLDDQSSWTVKGDAEKITAPYQLIVVMPSGGAYGGYDDWYNDGAGGPPMWETYHIDQLLPWIDQHFSTIDGREGRAIAGLSMGGAGSMGYASRHPDLFSAAGSFSGAVDTNNLFVQPLTETAGAQDLVPPGQEYGHRPQQEIRWRGHNPWDMAENLRGQLLEVDTGDGGPGGPGGDTGDPVEADVYQQSVAFHERLDELGIPHIWDYYGAGGHAWYYWNRDLSQFLPRIMALFADPPPPPAQFEYKTILPAYDVWGWHVAIDRPALEFSDLRRAGRDGFALSGSGKALVTTARYWKPGTALNVTTESGGGVTHQSMSADDHGRLTVPVTLGPANAYQEYTPDAQAWMVQTNPWADTGRALDEVQRWPVYSTSVSITGKGAARASSRRSARRHAARRRVARKRHHRRR